MNACRLCLASALSAVLATPPASAVQRTFVASYGLDTNPCSITSPCRTFSRALTQTDPSGEVIVLDSAGYGAFSISQSVSVIAPEGVYAGISVFPASFEGVFIGGTNLRVVLRGLTINGQGGDTGITYQGSGTLHIERCILSNLVGAGLSLQPSGATELYIADSVFRNNGSDGAFIFGNVKGSVERSRFVDNAAVGLAVGQNASVSVKDSVASGNTQSGFRVDAGGGETARLSVANSVASNNGLSGLFAFAVGGGSSTLVADGNTVMGNSTGIGANALDTPASTASVTLTRNTVVRNTTGIFQNGISVFRSLRDNAVSDNGTDVVGAVGTLTGQ